MRGSIADERTQFCELLFLLPTGSRRESIQILQETLHLVGQRFRLPFKWRARIAEPFAFADVFLGDLVYLLLQLFRRLLYVFGDFWYVGLAGIRLPLRARRAQRVLQSLNRLAVFGRALFHGVQLIHGCAPRRAILRGKLHVRIILDHDFLRCFPGPGLDFNCVLSGFYSRAARTFPVSGVDGLHLFRRGLCGSIVTQVPIRAIHAGRARSVQLAHYLPVFVGDGDLDLAFFL